MNVQQYANAIQNYGVGVAIGKFCETDIGVKVGVMLAVGVGMRGIQPL
jgi:hypothetical protein